MARGWTFRSFKADLLRDRRAAEYEVFRIISREISNKRNRYLQATTVSSVGIRPYVPVIRDLDDIDVVFPRGVPLNQIIDIANACTGHTGIFPMTEPNRSIRVMYQTIPARDADPTSGFSIHLHWAGVWYDSTLFELDDLFFQGTRWVEVPSGGSLPALLPIPKVEDLFLLKATKFLGYDKVDMLSMLSLRKLDLGYIRARAHALGKLQMIRSHLEQVKTDSAPLRKEWALSHLAHMSHTVQATIAANLENLLHLLA